MQGSSVDMLVNFSDWPVSRPVGTILIQTCDVTIPKNSIAVLLCAIAVVLVCKMKLGLIVSVLKV